MTSDPSNSSRVTSVLGSQEIQLRVGKVSCGMFNFTESSEGVCTCISPPSPNSRRRKRREGEGPADTGGWGRDRQLHYSPELISTSLSIGRAAE